MKSALLLISLLFASRQLWPKDYIIYAVAHQLPMGDPNEVMHKDYYVNMGNQQGLKKGTTLNVYRSVAMSDPYETKNKYSHSIKIGEIKILHAEAGSSIARTQTFLKGEDVPIFDVENFMIGDRVQVKIDD